MPRTSVNLYIMFLPKGSLMLNICGKIAMTEDPDRAFVATQEVDVKVMQS